MLDKKKVIAWNKQRIGLVLSGGGAKGAYEAGVFNALYVLDMVDKISVVSGTSVGALNTLLFAMNSRELNSRIWKMIDFRSVLAKPEKQIKAREKEEKASVLETLKSLISNKEDRAAEIAEILMGVSRDEDAMFTQKGLRDLLEICIDTEKIKAYGRHLYACAYDIEDMKPKYFLLNDRPRAEIIDIVLASAAIPYVFPPVMIDGRLYADGGVNNPAYPDKNGDVTPIKPLAAYDLNMIVVIHLNQEPWEAGEEFQDVQVINLYPSKPLEPVKGAGTLNFTRGALEEKMRQGYIDAMASLGPVVFDLIRQG
ncbi:MAG: patatin-like phospholipase family protein [Eubacteriales bacterium]|nr:patatin-like phospholipase family protein [Eubacteriales bacterium]